MQRGVSRFVLECVTRLVRSLAQRGEQSAVAVRQRKDETLVSRVVMVAQHLVVLGDFHVMNARTDQGFGVRLPPL